MIGLYLAQSLLRGEKLHIAWNLTLKNVTYETLSVAHIPLDLKFGTSYDQNSFKYPPLGLNVFILWVY